MCTLCCLWLFIEFRLHPSAPFAPFARATSNSIAGSQPVFRLRAFFPPVQWIGATNYGAERREMKEAKAQRLVAAGMDRLGWTERDLEGARKGDARKVRMAVRLRRETTISLKWIAKRLVMGSWTNVSNLLGVEKAKTGTHFTK